MAGKSKFKERIEQQIKNCEADLENLAAQIQKLEHRREAVHVMINMCQDMLEEERE